MAPAALPDALCAGAATGVAVADAIAETSGVQVGLKWPNDLLFDGDKLGGILVENCPGGVVAGIGFVLTKQTGIVGIDLDHCVENGIVNTWAAGIIESVGGFAELSPSGTGVHIYIKGSLPWPNKRTNGIEIYSHNSYLTVTGHWLQVKGALSAIAA